MSDTPNDKWEPCGPCGGLGRMMRMADKALVTCGYCDGDMRIAIHGRIANILSTVTDTPETDAFLTAENCTRDNPVAFDWLVGFARSIERKTANAYKVYQACNDDLIKCDEEVMRWFKAASPYATPGSLEEGLKKLREELIEECALICESRAGEGQYAESQAAWRILLSAAHAIRALKNFQPDVPIDSTVKPSAWD